MMAKSNKELQRTGILGLPQKWSVGVRVIGTYGLAVFLVLWYVFRMHPAEVKRYDKLNTSITKLTEKVENLAEVVKDDQIILKESQSTQLEELFTKCVAYKIADSIIEYKKIQDIIPTPLLELKQKLENTLIIDTKLAEGLLYDDGRDIARVIKDKILKSKLAEGFATYADIEDYECLRANRDILSALFKDDILVVIRP